MAPLTDSVDTGSPDDLLCSYSSQVMDALDRLAPMKRMVVTDRPKQIWYTPELAEARAALQSLERKWCTSKLEIDRQIFVQNRDAYYRRIDDAKCAHHRWRIQCADDEKLFKIVDVMIGKGCNAPSTVPSGIPAKQVPDKFGQFFAKKVENFRGRFGLRHFVDDVSFNGRQFSEFRPLTEDHVRKVVMESPTKSCSLGHSDGFAEKRHCCLPTVRHESHQFLLKDWFYTGSAQKCYCHATSKEVWSRC